MADYTVGDLCNFIAKSCGKEPLPIFKNKTVDKNNEQVALTFAEENAPLKKKKTKSVMQNCMLNSASSDLKPSIDAFKPKKNKSEASSNIKKDQIVTAAAAPIKAKKRKHEVIQTINAEDSGCITGTMNEENMSIPSKRPKKHKKKKNSDAACNDQSKCLDEVVRTYDNGAENCISASKGVDNTSQNSNLPYNASNEESSTFNLNRPKKPTVRSISFKNKQINPIMQKKLAKIKQRMDEALPAKHPDAEERTIYVGNVSLDVKRKDLEKFFQNYGDVETVRIRGIGVQELGISKKEAITQNKTHPDRRTVIAYIRFEDVSSAENALIANGEVLQGLHLRVDSASGKPNTDKNSVFVGNLCWSIEDEDMWTAFDSCGKITNVRVVRSASTGAGKGFAFVSFDSADAVELALQLNGRKVKRRPMRIVRTVKKDKSFQKNFRPENKMKPADGSNISFLKGDKPKHLKEKLQMRHKKFQNKKLMDNFSGSKTSNEKGFKKKAKSNLKQKHMSKDQKKKRYIARLLTGEPPKMKNTSK